MKSKPNPSEQFSALFPGRGPVRVNALFPAERSSLTGRCNWRSGRSGRRSEVGAELPAGGRQRAQWRSLAAGLNTKH